MNQPGRLDERAEAKELVRQSVDIVDLVGRYLPLRREGRNFKALCPWHDDSRPSLQVNPERQSFRCWVCDIGGDVFQFVMRIEGLAFPEAVEQLAERYNVALPKRSARSAEVAEERQRLYRVLAWAEAQFHDFLLRAPEAEPARRYLDDRSLAAECVARFHLGFAPDRWDWLLGRTAGTSYDAKLLERAGLVAPRNSGSGHYDRFRGRLMFSIRDPQGRPVGFGGRVLPGAATDMAKYVNSPETPLFEKSKLLYGLDLARDTLSKTRTALVMEGYTDVITAHQFGFTNALAVLGTALGPDHVRLLKRYADRIVLILDGDEAGRRRTDEVLDLFVAEQVDLRVLTLPDELDPAEFLLERGAPAFSTLVDGAVDALDHHLERRTAGLDASSGTHQASQAIESVLRTIARAPAASWDPAAPEMLRMSQILGRLARRFQIPESTLRTRLAGLRAASPVASLAPLRHSAEPPPPPPGPSRVDPALAELLQILLVAPELAASLPDQVDDPHWEGPAADIFRRCRERARSGTLPTLERLLHEFEDPATQSLLVRLDEAGHALKTEPAVRLEQWLHRFDRLRQEAANRRDGAAIVQDSARADAASVQGLAALFERARRLHGISSPTEG